MRRRRDPYGDPYDRPRRYADGGTVDDDDTLSNTAMVQVTPPTPEALSRASGFVQQRQAAIDQRDKEVRDIQEKQQLNADQMSKILDETRDAIKRGRSGTNTAMLKMGAAMMTTPGHFGTSVGAGLGALAKGIDEDRAAEASDEFKLADLQIKKMTLQNAPLEQRMAYIKALQTGDIAAMRNIEQALIKAQLAGTKSTQTTLEKNFNLWLQDPKNAGKTLSDYQQHLANLKPTTDEREWRLWQQKPGNENKTYPEYKEWLQSVQARTPADTQYAAQINREREEHNKKNNLKEGDPGFLPPVDLITAGAMKKEAEQKASAAGRTTGESEAKIKFDLPTYELGIERASKTVDDMLKHPGITNAVGRAWAEVTPIPGSPKADFVAKHEYLVGQVYEQAFQGMKGAGAITEQEGLAAAKSKLNAARTQSTEAYKAALEEYKYWLGRSLEVQRKKAGVTGTGGGNQAPTPPGQTGQTRGGGLEEGRVGTDQRTGKRVIVRNGKIVPLEE